MLKSLYLIEPIQERRSSSLIAAKVDVALILYRMLGEQDADDYLQNARVPAHVWARIIAQPEACRQQSSIAQAGGQSVIPTERRLQLAI
jgi:hypothetical protein